MYEKMDPHFGKRYRRDRSADALIEHADRQRVGAGSVNVQPFFTSAVTSVTQRANLNDVIGTVTVENRSSVPVSIFSVSGGDEAPSGIPMFIVPPKYWKRFPLSTAGANSIVASAAQDVGPGQVTLIVDSETRSYATGPLGPGE